MPAYERTYLTRKKRELFKMPKMKTNSSAKKRFRFTATGKVIRTQSKKRHGMINLSNQKCRDGRGTTIMADVDARGVIRHLMPYGGR